jgi:hypothetical protein
MKALRIGTNKAECRFAIVPTEGSFAVYREAQNYAAHVRGGIAKTWRYVEKGLTLEAAEALFERKIAGKQKP